MIYSMTAFARMETQADIGQLVCEMRSVNHRYLEINIHMPEALRPMEMMVREHIRQTIKRGKVECVWRFQPIANDKTELFKINIELAKELCKTSEKVADFLSDPAEINPTDILRFHGVLEMKEIDLVQLQKHLIKLLNQTLEELIKARNREGEELKSFVLQRADNISQELLKVKERMPIVITDQQERILKRFQDAKIELDPQRLEQEMVLFANRVDVSEEVDRAEMHIKEIRRVLHNGGMTGRRLDFLLQELNREANTLGSKSTDSLITHVAVELKVLTEQMREQIQNIE